MNLSRVITRQCFTHSIKCSRAFSKVATATENSQLQKKEQDRIQAFKPKPHDAVEKRVPFAKRLFIGEFDTDVLTFPEVLEKEQHETLHSMVKPIEGFFEAKVDSKQIDEDGEIPEDVLQGLKDLGLFGLQIPQEHGGLGLNATEFARINEIISLDGGIAVTLAAHQSIGLKGLLLYGTEDQKKKYLPKLATEEKIAAFCLTEPSSGSDAQSIQTSAKMSPCGKHWLLNGSKIWISNGGIADFFTVFARTADKNVDKNIPNRITAFAVERKFGGITNGRPEDKLGIRGSNTCEVHFDNTPVPVENVIGEVGDGFKVAVNILNSGRFSMGSACAGALRRSLSLVTEHVINRKQFGKPLHEYGLIQQKLTDIATSTYVMESMTYLTAGMIDSNIYEDCAVEAAMVKVLSSEMAWHCVSEAMQIFGGMGYMKDQPFELQLRDTRILQIFEGTNEILRLFIALMGVQVAGNKLQDIVQKVRNPFRNPQAAFRLLIKEIFSNRNNPKLKMELFNYLHPTLGIAANSLEYCVYKLQLCTEFLLKKHGREIIHEQFDLKRLADISIHIFAMSATLSRASRSMCIGLRNHHEEALLASYYTQITRAKVDRWSQEIMDGGSQTGDVAVKELSKVIVHNKGYFCEHPLSRTYW